MGANKAGRMDTVRASADSGRSSGDGEVITLSCDGQGRNVIADADAANESLIVHTQGKAPSKADRKGIVDSTEPGFWERVKITLRRWFC